MNVEFFVALLMLAAINHTATAQCGGILIADVSFRTLSYNATVINNKTEETCTWYISPSSSEPSDSYLSLNWTKFDVRGKLPACSDYIEVFLTRSYESIGRYCSDNLIASAPFNMYSYDGHAKIVFYSKARTRTSSFSLTYDTYHSGHVGLFGRTSSTDCYRNDDNTDVNIYVTGGWPYGYTAVPSTIYQTRFGSGQNVNSMIAVMDIDMETRWDSTCSYDYFRVLQSESTGGFKYDLVGKLCRSKPYYFTATMKYVWMQYRRSETSFKRGGNVGYLSYKIDPSQITTVPQPTRNPWPDTSNSGRTVRISYIVYLAGFVILASLVY